LYFQRQLEDSTIIERKRVLIVNNNNGERFDTSSIKHEKKLSHFILLRKRPTAPNTPRVDIIISYILLKFDEAKSFKPSIIFPNETAIHLLNF
jgi:aspartate 1-decarboxylase